MRAADAVEIFDCEQGSDAWFEAKLGVPSASRFSDALAGGEGKLRTRYMRDLVGERVSGVPAESFENAAMRRGREMERAARERYAEATFADCQRVGFAVNRALLRYDALGASPDLLVGAEGGAEFKSMAPHLLIEVLDRGAAGFPTEHRAQCQGNMLVFGRRWWDLDLFWPGFPRCRFRVERDERYLSEMVAGLESFCFDVREGVKRLESMKARAR